MSILDTVTLNGVDYSIAGSGSGESTTSIDNDALKLAYMFPTYTENVLDTDGSVITGTGNVSDFLPVIGGETLTLSSAVFKKVAYYDSAKTFISLVSVSTGIADYTVPTSACYARYQTILNGGSPKPLFVRKKDIPENSGFYDLIFSPLKSSVSISITGDSNTYGYGLSDRTTEAWSYLLANALADITSLRYGSQSKWVESLGATSYSTGFKYMANSQMSIWTDATTITIGYSVSYSGAWSWYVDDVLLDSTSVTSITLDGDLHKFTVKFTGGQTVDPYFTIPKAITFTNSAVSGVGPNNVTFTSDCDWLIVMIGTNARTIEWGDLRNTLCEYSGKGTFIVPFPNHKTDATYTYSEIQTYATLKNSFENLGFDVVDLSAIIGNVFYDNTLYQSDKIHFNADGHRYIANAVSGALGLPLYLATTE